MRLLVENGTQRPQGAGKEAISDGWMPFRTDSHQASSSDSNRKLRKGPRIKQKSRNWLGRDDGKPQAGSASELLTSSSSKLARIGSIRPFAFLHVSYALLFTAFVRGLFPIACFSLQLNPLDKGSLIGCLEGQHPSLLVLSGFAKYLDQ